MALELADIFHRYGPAYRQKYANRLLPSHRRVMRAIEQCRTEALGGQVYTCPNCGEVRYSYHSCRNRHCPKCQNQRTQEWLEAQQDLLLPVPYFMLTFTLPAALRPLARSHQTLFYNLLFQASAAATQLLARDPRFAVSHRRAAVVRGTNGVGGQIGMLGILHTWARNLSYHPHIHYLVPGGGLAADGQAWLPARHNFLLPVKALSTIFRAKFLHALHQSPLANTIPSNVWKQEWVVHCRVGLRQTGWQWPHRTEVPGTLHLPRRHQQPPSGQTGRYARSGHFSLSHFRYRRDQVLHPPRRRVHPPLLAACPPQGLR